MRIRPNKRDFSAVESLLLERYKANKPKKVRLERDGGVTVSIEVSGENQLGNIVKSRVRLWCGSFDKMIGEAKKRDHRNECSADNR